jgi:hypothetical protein
LSALLPHELIPACLPSALATEGVRLGLPAVPEEEEEEE